LLLDNFCKTSSIPVVTPKNNGNLFYTHSNNRRNSGKTYSADLNGSLNILRGVVGDSIFDKKSIEELVVSPIKVTPYKARNIVKYFW
jgi:hypothetical protein